jgi:hypothetical protein
MSMLVELPTASYPTQLQPTLSDAGTYNFDTARAMAWIAQLAYETANPDKIDRILMGWKLTRSRLLKSATSGLLPLVDTRGLVLHGCGGTVVAFAGTDPLVPANWLTNFDTLPAPDDIHSGFERATKAVWPELRSAVLAGGGGSKPLYLVGHSLGAALAVIAAKLLHNDGLARVSAVYTLGMPRCGGRRFVADYGDELGSSTYRLVHGDDIVPTVPPSELGFRHVGCLLRCGHNASFDPMAHPDPAQSDEPSFGGSVLQGIQHLLHAAIDLDLPEATQPGRLGEAYRFLPPAIGDHIPSRYLTALGFKL